MAKETKKPQQKEFKIPENVKQMMKLSFKKFKKRNKDYYDSKKDLKKAFYGEVLDLLPDSISLLVKYGHIEAVREVKGEIYSKIFEPDFIKYLGKELKNGTEIDNIALFPNIISRYIDEAKKQAEIEQAENPDVTVDFDVSDVIEISKTILKKKMKKMTKAGIDEALAFDILSAIPNEKILQKSQNFHIRNLFMILYEHAKTKEINFSKIIDIVFKDGDYVNCVICFALLERKEKITNFNETQKKLFNDITEYCFKTMESMKKEEIMSILKAYVTARKRDESQNKDTNRRYYISSLPESDYPKILKVMEKMIDGNNEIKKYF